MSESVDWVSRIGIGVKRRKRKKKRKRKESRGLCRRVRYMQGGYVDMYVSVCQYVCVNADKCVVY